MPLTNLTSLSKQTNSSKNHFTTFSTRIKIYYAVTILVLSSIIPKTTSFLIPSRVGGVVTSASKSSKYPFRYHSTSSDMSLEEGVIASNLAWVKDRISQTTKKTPSQSVRLIAVSKTKPNELLQQAYDAGQRYFGENYVQELCGKVNDLPSDIQWHFIGPLQSNKANGLVKTVGLDQLACVETVATLKLAKKLNKAVMDYIEENDTDADKQKKLMIYLQVNTSGEESKSGLIPGDNILDVARSIREECEHLKIGGLMTIGAPGDFSCFDTLVDCRVALAEDMGIDEHDLDLSMGMSGDFEEAIERGATNVRVGSTIFGARDYSNK